MMSKAATAAGVLLFGVASSAQALLLTYDFTGVVENIQISRPGTGAHEGFDLSEGAAASGHITFELDGFSMPRDDQRQRTVHYTVKDFAMTVGPLDLNVRGMTQGLRPIDISNNKNGQDVIRYGEYYATAGYKHPTQTGPLDVLLLEFTGDLNTLNNEILQNVRHLDRFDSKTFLLSNEGGLDMMDAEKALYTASGRFDSFARRHGPGLDVVPNPEPASLALGALGLAGAAFIRRRRKRA